MSPRFPYSMMTSLVKLNRLITLKSLIQMTASEASRLLA